MNKFFNTVFQSALQEQLYKRTNKIYYHVSPNSFNVFKPSGEYSRDKDNIMEGTFLTPKWEMIMDYAQYLWNRKVDPKLPLYLYYCRLIKPLNVFNPSSKTDIKNLTDYILNSDDPKQIFKRIYKGGGNNSSLYSFFQHIQKTHDWQTMENPELVQIVKLLGYEGFASSENGLGNICTFLPESIKILKQEVINSEEFETKYPTKTAPQYKVHLDKHQLEKDYPNKDIDDNFTKIVFEGPDEDISILDLDYLTTNKRELGQDLTGEDIKRAFRKDNPYISFNNGTFSWDNETFIDAEEVADQINLSY